MKIVFKGVVQGVGFRPTIYRIAKKLGLKGYVLNKGSEVEVVIDKKTNKFIEEVTKNLPSIAHITEIIKKTDNRTFTDFRILHSSKGAHESLIPVDIATCEECQKELKNKKNRRHNYPFTNCTICGARYSLIKTVPYDRERTSMDDFSLCKDCVKEYTDPFNRRYHAQTISCPKCGPFYNIYDIKQKKINNENPIEYFAEKIDEGSIGVIKSWGGMHLCCKISEIKRFRQWYDRPQKSFAIMVKDIKTAEKYAELTSDEKKLLLSKSRPIVLAEKKKAENISPGLNTIGLFLPYTGLHHILFSYLKRDELIMTSANLPGEPMITNNQDVFSLKADYYLLHNRRIPNRVDDSVIKTWNGNNFFLRKSRGFIPNPLNVKYKSHVLSVGAGENITGAISVNKKVYLTQYIGNSKYYSTLVFLEKSLRHLMELTMKKISIDAVGMDFHPGYNTRKTAELFSKEFNVPFFEIQHHWAHAASLQVDRGIDECIVLTLDGLGYGTDGKFWGGDILYSTYNKYERVGHLSYIPLIGGDMATRDPRRLVFGIFQNFDIDMFFKDQEANIFRKMIEKSPLSCSMGRILDAIAAYFGICTKRTYDGEPAMKLEKYLKKGKDVHSFNVKIKDNIVDTIDLFYQLYTQVKPPFTEKQIADWSHSFIKSIIDGLCDIAIQKADEKNVKNIGLSGGVTYNIPINEMVFNKIKETDLNLIVHNRLPNGDGCISIGQNAIIGNMLE